MMDDRPPGWETDPKQEAPFKGNPPGTDYGHPRQLPQEPSLAEQIDRVATRLEGLNADYEVHRHGQEEISGLKERVRQLEDLIGRVDALERRLGP